MTAGSSSAVLSTNSRPYRCIVGVMTVAMFTMHGAIYLYLKTEGELQQRIHAWMWRGFGFFLATYILVTIMTLGPRPPPIKDFRRAPVGMVGRDPQRAGDRQYPRAHLPTPPRLRVHLLERHNRRAQSASSASHCSPNLVTSRPRSKTASRFTTPHHPTKRSSS